MSTRDPIASIQGNPEEEDRDNHPQIHCNRFPPKEESRPKLADPMAYDYEVKSWPWFFEEMINRQKKHDMRDMRDRPYKVGDRMKLREYDPITGQYTGREAIAKITYITSNTTPCAMSSGALDRNFAILSLDVVLAWDADS